MGQCDALLKIGAYDVYVYIHIHYVYIKIGAYEKRMG